MPPDGLGGGYQGNGRRGKPSKLECGLSTVGMTVVGTFLGIMTPITLVVTIPLVGFMGYKYFTMDD